LVLTLAASRPRGSCNAGKEEFEMKFAMRWAPGSAFALAMIVAVTAHAVGPRRGSTSTTPPVAAAPEALPAPGVAPVPAVSPAPSLPPMSGLAPLARLRHLLPPKGWYGVSLRCSDCSIRRDDEEGAVLEWRFRVEPEVASVEADSPADRAGVQEGDMITHIDGAKITSRDGGKRFGAIAPGDKVKWTLKRDGKSLNVIITADERPDEWSAWAGDQDALLRAEEELERANEKIQLRLRGSDLDLKGQREALLDAQRQMEEVRRHLGRSTPRAYAWGYSTTPAPEAERRAAERAMRADEERAKRLRYQGDVGSSHVEVRGSSRVVVTEDDDGNLIIDTPDATIKVEKKP
jgi:hypothetical protein